MRDACSLPWRWPLALLAGLLVAGPATAQQVFPVPRLSTLTPPGGKAGTKVEVTPGGSDLDEVSGLFFSHPGLKVERVPDPPKPARPKGKPQPPTPAPPPRFAVTIAPDVPPGVYDARVTGKWGVSNPRLFVVGERDEVQEKEPNNDVNQAQKVAVNSTINGVVNANVDVDYYAFPGKAGERVVVHCAASSIDSRLVPFLQVYSAGGRLLGSNRQYHEQDAVLDCVLPDDGEYQVRVCQFAHQAGSAEYFYRLTVTTGPWLDAVYPPAVEPGQAAAVTLYGRNLPGGQPDPGAVLDGRPLDRATAQVTAPPADRPLAFGEALPARSGSLDGFEYRVRGPGGTSNPVLLLYADGPVVLDNEDNDAPEEAQEVTAPCTVCGRLEKRGDRDWYAFTAKKGDVLVLEAYADRLGTPVDLYFALRRADNGQAVGEFDDHPEVPQLAGHFFTRTEDPKTRFVAPADGRYELMVRSRTAELRAGPRFVYALSVRPERPDFHVVVVANDEGSMGGCTVRQASSQDLQVVCFRRDGFNGPVELKVEGLPKGVTCPPQVLGPNQKETSLVVTAAADAPASQAEIRVTGTAEIGGKPVVREARTGCLVWPVPPQQQNFPAVSRLSQSLWLAVRPRGPYSLDTSIRDVAVPVGGQVALKVKVNRHFPDFKAPVQLRRLAAPAQPNGQPINVPNVNISGGEAEVKFTVPGNTAPGDYNLVFQGMGQFPFARDPEGKRKQNIQVYQVTPPVRVTVYNGVGQLEVPAQVVVPPGGSVPVTVKVRRLNGYGGEFKLQLAATPGLQGLSAAPAAIPAGANEGKLVLQAAKGARPGISRDVVIRATAQVKQQNLTHDVKLTVAVAANAADVGLRPSSKEVVLLADGADGWKYQPADKVKGDAWRTPGFDDRGWKAGKAPLGYGEEELGSRKGTTIAADGEPVLFRRSFDVPAEAVSAKGAAFRLQVASDNSAEVYVNGQPADRDPEADHEFRYWNREVELPVKLLKPGKNVIAVRVDNGAGSSDLFLDVKVTALVPPGGK